MHRCLSAAIVASLLMLSSGPLSLAEGVSGEKQYVRANTLRIRGAATVNAEIIDRLSAGHPVYVLAETDGWAFIEYSRDGGSDRYRGWVSSEFVR